MDQQPKIPTLKDSQKPQVKVRGMSIGLTLAERLKQFKKKDLAFILAGLGVLFMAPLAEHFMMAPEAADGSLQAGWGKGGSGSGGPGANNMFGAGGSPYDRTDGLAPGSPTGGGSDVITPLNVRDPSALVMGPGAAQQPPTNSAMPATPPVSAPSSRSDSDLKDALAASARGVGAAAKRAPLPIPKVAMVGSGLRGLGVAGGSTSSSASLGPINAGNVPNRAAGGDSTGNARRSKDYAGVTRGQTSGGGGMEALKAAAGKQADNMTRGGGAATDLNAAAQTAIPSGGEGRGGGGPGSGKDDKPGGGNADKGSKTTGESLAFLNMKERMQKDLEMEYKKKELNDMGLLWSQMRNEGLKTFMTKGIVEPLATGFGKCVGAMFGGDPCMAGASDSTPVIKCANPPNTTLLISDGYAMDGSGVVRDGKGNVMSGYTGCVKGSIPKSGGASGAAAANPAAVTNTGGSVYSKAMSQYKNLGDVGGTCGWFGQQLKEGSSGTTGTAGVPATGRSLDSKLVAHYGKVQEDLKKVSAARQLLDGTAVACGDASPAAATPAPAAAAAPILSNQAMVISNLDVTATNLRKVVEKSGNEAQATLASAQTTITGMVVQPYGAAETSIGQLPAGLESMSFKADPAFAKSAGAEYSKTMEKAEAARKDVVALIGKVKTAQATLKEPVANVQTIAKEGGTLPTAIGVNDQFKGLMSKVTSSNEAKEFADPELALEGVKPIKADGQPKEGVKPTTDKSTAANKAIEDALAKRTEVLREAKTEADAAKAAGQPVPPKPKGTPVNAELTKVPEAMTGMRQQEYDALGSVLAGVTKAKEGIDGKGGTPAGDATVVPTNP